MPTPFTNIRPEQLSLATEVRDSEYRTPNEYFVAKYPEQFKQHGSPFLELSQAIDSFTCAIIPVSINTDFFAACLGGRKDLAHHVVYLESELAFYFRDWDGIFKPTTAEKMANLHRGLLMRCAQEMPANVNKLNLVNEFRSDRVAKAVVQRSKSILAAGSDFFSGTSPHQRIKGPELFDRLMRVLCETMLERSADGCLTVTQAYAAFTKLAQMRQLGSLKRSMFRAEMQDLMKDFYGVSLRRDVPNELGKHQEAWKGLRLVEKRVLAA